MSKHISPSNIILASIFGLIVHPIIFWKIALKNTSKKRKLISIGLSVIVICAFVDTLFFADSNTLMIVGYCLFVLSFYFVLALTLSFKEPTYTVVFLVWLIGSKIFLFILSLF